MSPVTLQCPPSKTITQIESRPQVIVTQVYPQTVVSQPLTQLVPPPVCPSPIPTPANCPPKTLVVEVPGPQGPQGPPGTDTGSTPSITGVSAEFTPLLKGTPVALVGGMFRRAASYAPFNEVIGLVMDDVIVQGAAGRVQTSGPIEQPVPEWEAIMGMPGGLAPGALHFLSGTGHLTPFAPTAQDEFVAPVGRAASPTEFIIDIDTQVLL